MNQPSGLSKRPDTIKECESGVGSGLVDCAGMDEKPEVTVDLMNNTEEIMVRITTGTIVAPNPDAVADPDAVSAPVADPVAAPVADNGLRPRHRFLQQKTPAPVSRAGFHSDG